MAKKETQIRKRKSYQRFKEFLAIVKTKDEKVIMEEMFKMMDKFYAFHSETASQYAKESLELLFQEEGL